MLVLRRRTLALILAVALLTGFLGGLAGAEQGHMRAALLALRTARSELERAASNKGGHRERALLLVDQAIEQVQLGIQAGRE